MSARHKSWESHEAIDALRYVERSVIAEYGQQTRGSLATLLLSMCVMTTDVFIVQDVKKSSTLNYGFMF